MRIHSASLTTRGTHGSKNPSLFAAKVPRKFGTENMASRRLQDPSNAYTPRPFPDIHIDDPCTFFSNPRNNPPVNLLSTAPPREPPSLPSFRDDYNHGRRPSEQQQQQQKQYPKPIGSGIPIPSKTTIVPVNVPPIYPNAPSSSASKSHAGRTPPASLPRNPQRKPYQGESSRWVWPAQQPMSFDAYQQKREQLKSRKDESDDEPALDDLPGLLKRSKKPYPRIVIEACVETVLNRHQRRCVQYGWREVNCTTEEYRTEIEGSEDTSDDSDTEAPPPEPVVAPKKEEPIREEDDLVIISSDPTMTPSSEKDEEEWTQLDEAESDSEWAEVGTPTLPTFPPTKSTATQTTPAPPPAHPLPALPTLPPPQPQSLILPADPKIYRYTSTFASPTHLRRNMLPPINKVDAGNYASIVEFLAKQAPTGLVSTFLNVYDEEFKKDSVSGGEGGLFLVDLLEGISTLYELVGRKKRRRDRKVMEIVVKALGSLWRFSEGEVVRYWRSREGVVGKVWGVWERVVEEEDEGLVGTMLKEGLGKVVGLRRVLGLVRRRGTVDMREMVEEAVGLSEDMEVEIGGREWEGLGAGGWDWEPFRGEEMRLLRAGDT
ncbi:hypothetical protein BJ508DRAFT_63695 [Ascobolus immersus RN42]|uniref:Uncharacterized protein n=1 Tax=Ascobolus immersus RN42 TaxID=1160509 RepID=A0A3N4IU28_ASCIM|nr:hypothetical protein BJ508DRAFT_63695 [Ascobolus immersus RN42]